MKRCLLVVFSALATLMLPTAPSVNHGVAFAKSSSTNQWQRNLIYQRTLQNQRVQRQNAINQRRIRDAQRRHEANRQKQLRADHARRLREAAKIHQREILKKQRLKDQDRIRQQQNVRKRQQQEKRARDHNKTFLAVLMISRLQIQSRLNQLPKPSVDRRLTRNKIVVARAIRPRPSRPKVSDRCSFHGDTLVLTDQGMVPIRDIRVGEHRIWAMDEYTGEADWKPVSAKYSSEYPETVSIAIRDPETGHIQTILSNRIHPFFVKNGIDGDVLHLAGSVGVNGLLRPVGEWIEAQDLQPGQRLLEANGNDWSEVVSTRIETSTLRAFNLTVADFRTYFVKAPGNEKADAIWVHNTCPKIRASSAKIGEIVKTPGTHEQDFTKLPRGQGFRNNQTGEIWQKSNTAHRGDVWKVGINRKPPTPSQKISVKSNGEVVKIDK